MGDETRSLGQVAYDVYLTGDPDYDAWNDLDELSQSEWRKVAQAVATIAREEGYREGLERAARWHEEHAVTRTEEASYFKKDGDIGAAKIHRRWAAGHRMQAVEIRRLKDEKR